MGVLRDLREVVKGLKRRGASAKFCPRCGSPRLKLSSGLDFWLVPGRYLCLDCGYRGPIVLEKEGDAAEEDEDENSNQNL